MYTVRQIEQIKEDAAEAINSYNRAVGRHEAAVKSLVSFLSDNNIVDTPTGELKEAEVALAVLTEKLEKESKAFEALIKEIDEFKETLPE